MKKWKEGKGKEKNKKRGKIESDDEDVGPNEYEEDGFVVKDDADEDDGDDDDVKTKSFSAAQKFSNE